MNRKWQLLCLVLTIALTISASLNMYQRFYASNNGSGGNPSPNNDATEELNFTFTWGPDSQKIVQGEFRLEIRMRWYGENLSMVITAKDDDYNEWDYIGLVFDTNRNGHIDIHDYSIALYANNMTQPSFLSENGFPGFAEITPRSGPHIVSFGPDTGYTFTVQFPCSDGYGGEWNPTESLKKANDNSLHLCFHDKDVADYTMGVFIRFLFYLPEQT